MERNHPTHDVGVIVGRFQVEELHAGHVELLSWVRDNHAKVIIALGVPAVHGRRNNPLDYQTRAMMLQAFDPKFVIVPLEDSKYDAVWAARLDTLVHALLLPCQTACLYGARDSFLSHYVGRYATQELVGDKALAGWSGSDQREKLRLPVRACADWRAGVIWASQNHWPRVDACVDIGILDTKGDYMLMGRKPNETAFRFIGGFADPKSPSFEADAGREVLEETGLIVQDITYIGSTIIDDWRYKAEKDKIKTLLFTARAALTASGHAAIPKAADDIEDVEWFKVKAFPIGDLVDTHVVLAEMLMQKGVIQCLNA